MKAVILAGGMGTRLREETEYRPKPMVEIGGRPILWHIMKNLSTQGIREFVICLGYKGDQIKDYFLNKKRYDAICDLTFDLFQSNVKFAVRKEYVEDEMLLDLPNVYTVDIPFGTFNLFGTKKTFEEVFRDE